MRKIADSSNSPSSIAIQRLRRCEIATERLFNDNAGALAQLDFASCCTTSRNTAGGMAR